MRLVLFSVFLCLLVPLSADAQRERFETAHALVAASAAAETGTYSNITESFDGALETNSDAVFGWIDVSVMEADTAL